MNQIRKLDRVLDEEHGDVVADEIEVPLFRVELHGEPTNVAGRIAGAGAAGDRREAREHRRLLLGVLQEGRPCQLAEGPIGLEVAVRARAARVDDPLGNSLVIEVGDLLAKDEVLEQDRTAHRRL